MSLFDAIAILFVVGIAYGISLALYRLYAHPLSRYPGPKLAAATQWYEFYFDVLKRGRFAWEIKRMHEVYGPVVRINPHELHVSEPDFYDELYAGPGKKRNKYDWATNLMMVKGSMWTTIDSDLHKLRRAPLAPYFSSSAIRKFDPVIRNKLDILCDKLENCRRNQEVVCLDVAFTALTTDIITQYAFGISYGFLEAAEFNPGWLKLLQGASEQSILTKHMPWLVDGLRRIPIAWVVKIKPQVASMMRFNKGIEASLNDAISGKNKQDSANHYPTIFHDILKSDLPLSELSPARLRSEGIVVVAAGTLTAAHYLKSTAYHILANPTVLQRLRNEIKEAFPDPDVLPPFSDLNQLAYFNAVVNEGFRLSHGVITRLTRVAPNEDLHVAGFTIPAGTPISMSSWLIHLNPELFPSPHEFRPERWLEPGAERLKKYLVNFTKGTRVCLGKDLAKTQIAYTLYLLISRWVGVEGQGMELFQTTSRDVEIERDFFNPFAALDSKGVRVILK